MTDSIALSTLPSPLQWDTLPAAWALVGGDQLTIAAGPKTDLFIDPQGGSAALNAPRLVFRPDGDWMLSARVRVEFVSTYDAGAIVLCFEYSPQGRPTVVSVVTRGSSDDANAFAVDGDEVALRVARLGAAFAFHACTDGEHWQLVRYFTLGMGDAISVGFTGQSPSGSGCTATFADIRFIPERLADPRNGN